MTFDEFVTKYVISHDFDDIEILFIRLSFYLKTKWFSDNSFLYHLHWVILLPMKVPVRLRRTQIQAIEARWGRQNLILRFSQGISRIVVVD